MVTAVLNIICTQIFRFISFMIVSLYNLIVMLADADIMGNGTFDNMKSNIFGLIGLFMVFKLALSIVKYVTDPDKLSDSSTGAGKILTKVVVVLILLGTVDTAFDKAFELQGLILKNGVMEKLIFGTDSDENIDPDIGGLDIKTSDYLAYSILAPFVNFNVDEPIWGKNNKETETLDECDEFILATDTSKKDVCHSACADVIKAQDADAYESMCKDGLNKRNMYKALIDVAMLRINKKAVITIDGLFGLLIGAVCIIVLIVIAVGVAVRSVKLTFLNIIAPLPIITYIEPKSDSNSMFGKWWKETLKTFLELFIRLISFYFAIFVITKVLTSGPVTTYSGAAEYTFKDYPMVIIFLIIGCFLFALQVPKLVESLFGSMGGLARDAKSTGAIAGGIAGIAGGIVGGGISNAIGTAKNIKDANGGKLGFGGLVRSGLALGTGAVGTGARSVLGAAKGMKASGGGLSGGKWSDIASNAIGRTGALRNARAISYTTANGKVRSGGPSAYGRFAAMAGIRDDYSAVGRKKADVKSMENALRNYQNELARASSDRMATMQQYNSAVHEREMLEGNAQRIDKDMFKDIGGVYDEATHDFKFGSMSLSNMSSSDYQSVFQSARNAYNTRLGSDSSLNASQRSSMLSEFDKRFDMSNSTTFAMEKNRINDSIQKVKEYSAQLETARREETRLKSEYDTINSQYSTIQTNISDTNKNLAAANRQIETLNKANKK